MTIQEISAQLAAPFADSDIEWRYSSISKDKTSGLVVAYVTNRAIQNRLDAVLGIGGWKNEFVPWHADKKNNKESQLCGLSIWIEERNEWLTKYDGADDSETEPIKGGLSDSMKRAAVQWGIGRYLYEMDNVYANTEKEKFIKRSEYGKLNAAHQALVARLFGSKAPTPKPQSNGTPPAETQAPAPQNQQKPQVRPTQQARPAVQPQPRPQAQSVQNAPATPQAPAPERKQQNTVPPNSYKILRVATVANIKRKNENDTKLQLENADGKRFEVYVYYTNPQLAPGVVLTDCKITTIKNGDIVFYLLEEYTIYEQQNAA